MIKIGQYNLLKVIEVHHEGAVVSNGTDELPVPLNHCDESIITGAELKLFVYRIGGGRLIATTRKPKAVVGQFAPLRCVETNENGAFLDWGMDKDLFVPFSQMIGQMYADEIYVVRVLLDDVSDRIVATQKLRPFLKNPTEDEIPVGQKLRIMIIEIRDNGTIGIAEGGYKVYFNKTEFAERVQYGTIVEAYAKLYDDSDRLIVSRKPTLNDGWIESEKMILDMLKVNHGFIRLNDSSSPEKISQMTGLSKKTFKKVIGGLYKHRKIVIEDDGIRLVE